MARARLVLPTPGASSSRMWPSDTSPISARLIWSCLPRIVWPMLPARRGEALGEPGDVGLGRAAGAVGGRRPGGIAIVAGGGVRQPAPEARPCWGSSGVDPSVIVLVLRGSSWSWWSTGAWGRSVVVVVVGPVVVVVAGGNVVGRRGATPGRRAASGPGSALRSDPLKVTTTETRHDEPVAVKVARERSRLGLGLAHECARPAVPGRAAHLPVGRSGEPHGGGERLALPRTFGIDRDARTARAWATGPGRVAGSVRPHIVNCTVTSPARLGMVWFGVSDCSESRESQRTTTWVDPPGQLSVPCRVQPAAGVGAGCRASR